MSSPVVLTLRCPTCGGTLAAPTPPGTAAVWYACPHCASPVPVVAPRDPPPLFSWEVYPHLYPRLFAPQSPAGRIPKVGLATLFALCLFFAGVAGLLAVDGASALAPASYDVGGVVLLNGTTPLSGAAVVLSGENGLHERYVTDATGAFLFPDVPAGGVTLNASLAPLGFAVYHFFLTPLYQSTVEDPAHLSLSLNGDPMANDVTALQAPFPDLETFVASLWGGAAIVAVASAVAALGAVALRRGLSPTMAVAGSIGAVFVPVAVMELGLTGVFPYSWVVSIVAVTLGTSTAALLLLLMARTGPSPSS